MSDFGYSRRIVEQEDINTKLCRKVAMRNGHSVGEADFCENGDVGCPDCPFKGEGVKKHG